MNANKRPVAAAMRIGKSTGWLAAAAVAAAIALSSGHARAESNVITATGTATAHLNFSIIIPKFLYLQVGTGTYPTNVGTIDTLTFDMSAAIASIGNGTAQAGTGGDVGGGAVTARVVGNNFAAAPTLTATTAGAMSNGSGDTISWSEIQVAATAAGGSLVPAPIATVLPHPGSAANPFTDAGSTTSTLTVNSKVVNQAATWTFKYKNTNVPAPGTFGATVPNKGQVTYTIALP